MKEIETIKKMVADGVLTQEIADKYFPELKEDKEERIRKSLLRWVQSNSYTSIAGIPINDVIAWLEKQGEQKPSEWGEEGEQYVKDTLALLAFGASVHTISQVRDWLKSLRHKNHWKPSEEQMEALKKTIEYVNVNNTKPLLEELFEQLMTL